MPAPRRTVPRPNSSSGTGDSASTRAAWLAMIRDGLTGSWRMRTVKDTTRCFLYRRLRGSSLPGQTPPGRAGIFPPSWTGSPTIPHCSRGESETTASSPGPTAIPCRWARSPSHSMRTPPGRLPPWSAKSIRPALSSTLFLVSAETCGPSISRSGRRCRCSHRRSGPCPGPSHAYSRSWCPARARCLWTTSFSGSAARPRRLRLLSSTRPATSGPRPT